MLELIGGLIFYISFYHQRPYWMLFCAFGFWLVYLGEFVFNN